MNPAVQTLVVTEDIVLDTNATLRVRMVVEASHVTIDGNGATLEGPATPGDIDSFEGAGTGLLIEGCTNVVVRNLKASGFESGLEMRDCLACSIEGCDFSDNYDNPKFGWGELPARGAIICDRVRYCIFRENKGDQVWDGIHLRDSDDNLIMGNDLSHCSNVCAKLWNSSRNRFIENDLSYGIRIDRAAGEVHARDSTGVLIESGSNDNFWYRNDVTNGGDGVFIRPLNGWVSSGNVFIENDTSYGNNNCIEAWSPGNVYIRNKANHGSYGFWLGGSDQTLLIGNEAGHNGLPDGFHNAPEPLFGHGGIVLVGGSGTHLLVDGNHCHDNNGGGIVFRGDVETRGEKWRVQHWAIQANRLEKNRWALHGQYADDLFLGPNAALGNHAEDVLDGVASVIGERSARRAPVGSISGPSRAVVGVPAVFDATDYRDPAGLPLHFRWSGGGIGSTEAVVSHVFARPGLYRVSLTVDNGALAALDWRDVVVATGVVREIGTEGNASQWTGRGIGFADDPDCVEGRFSVRMVARPAPEGLPWAILRLPEGAAHGSTLSFWFKAVNSSVFAWQNEAIHVRLTFGGGAIEYTPQEKGWLWGAAQGEERRNWQHIVIPLAGGGGWKAATTGSPDLERVEEIALAMDSTGSELFTVWLDGLTIE